MGDERMEQPPGNTDLPGPPPREGVAWEDPSESSAAPGPAAVVKEDQAHLRALQRARQGRVAKVVVALVLLILFIVFIVQNTDPVDIDLVFGSVGTQLIWVMLGCGVVGGIAGYLIGRPSRHTRLHDGREKRKGKDRPSP